MPTVWENSYVDRLQPHFTRKNKLQEVAENVRRAIEPISLPDAALVLTAIATDVMTAVQMRNNRADVNEACATLRSAITSLELIEGNLDG